MNEVFGEYGIAAITLFVLYTAMRIIASLVNKKNDNYKINEIYEHIIHCKKCPYENDVRKKS